MVFSSLEFIFIFLPCFLAVYYCLPTAAGNFWIIIGSLIFYAYGVNFNPLYVLLMVFSILFSYMLGNGMSRQQNKRKRRLLLGIGLVYNFGWLIFFKYMGLPYLLPVGISFYTFQISSYLIDVYRRDIRPERSLIRFGTYVMMFPQLIAGPIVTYRTVRRQLQSRIKNARRINEGLKDFTVGLALKVLLANRLGSLWHEINTIGFDSITTPLAWMGIIAFSFQIYFDFYGYSLMAVGLGEMMGFKLPQNFRHPYVSLSMTEFWRRWHITLGAWFRDYIYIPLGGNRRGILRQLLNMLVVWTLTGIWHGSTRNFLFWGLFLFLVIMVEKLGWKKITEKIPLLGHAYMALLIPISWSIFEIADLAQLKLFLQRLFPFFGAKTVLQFQVDYLKYGKVYGTALLIGFIFSTEFPAKIYRKYANAPIVSILLLLLFWASVYCLYMGMDDPFLYYRF